jgi:hypothetical protein
MSKLGWLLLLAGILIPLSIFTGVAPLALATAPIPQWAWLATAAVGAFLVMLNRRPGN